MPVGGGAFGSWKKKLEFGPMDPGPKGMSDDDIAKMLKQGKYAPKDIQAGKKPKSKMPAKKKTALGGHRGT